MEEVLDVQRRLGNWTMENKENTPGKYNDVLTSMLMFNFDDGLTSISCVVRRQLSKRI